MMPPPIETPPRSWSPWQWLYGSAHRLRYAWLSRKAKRLPRPVVSVGNLHWGGGGKTPLVAAIAVHLRDAGRHVAILSRGYGSKGEGVRILSRGEGPLLGPKLAGDEPVLLAGDLPGVSVVVCPDRHHAGRHALHRLDPPPDLFLLDDGFSHLYLMRDLDLLAFPAVDPFAGGRLAPGGRLREPLKSAARAHAVLLTGADDSQGDAGKSLAEALRPCGFTGPGFACHTRSENAQLFGEGEIKTGARVVAVSGIARPEPFLDTVRSQGFEIAQHLSFPDHHEYPTATLEKIGSAYWSHSADLVLTTGKDRVKLQGRMDIPLAEIPIRAEPEPGFFEWLDQSLGMASRE
ncbi:MAG: tetraacyldisaccharide 4'-kinase [bacterium]|nr:tetraacyldisaccharide 4'-kinase [bacterium]